MNLLFPVLLGLLFVSIHYLFYSRVLLRLHLPQTLRHWLIGFLMANLTGVFGYLAGRYGFNPPHPLYFLMSLSIGVGFVLLLGIFLYETLHLLQRLVPFRAEKRLLFKRTTDMGFLALSGGYLGAGIAGGSKEPVVTFVDVDQNRFGDKSFRIVQISDMHIGGLIERDFVARSVETINRLEPDLIAITGDLVDARIDTLIEAVCELKHLKSRFGTYYVVGNHEYFHSIQETIDYVKQLGIRVLENESVRIGEFYIAGVHDLFGYRTGTFVPDIARALEGIPSDAPILLLAHQPKFIDFLGGAKPSLILSGHTHGGQFWPFGYLVSLAQPFVRGLHRLDDNCHIYVNSGIGFWGPPLRLGSQAEITCITWS